MKLYQKKNRLSKIKIDTIKEDKDGIVPRLNELIRLTRWVLYILLMIVMMFSLFFIRDVIQVIIGLFK